MLFSVYLFLFTTLYMFRVINRNTYIEKNLCITLIIYQDSLYDARSTKCKTHITLNNFCPQNLAVVR